MNHGTYTTLTPHDHPSSSIQHPKPYLLMPTTQLQTTKKHNTTSNNPPDTYNPAIHSFKPLCPQSHLAPSLPQRTPQLRQHISNAYDHLLQGIDEIVTSVHQKHHPTKSTTNTQTPNRKQQKSNPNTNIEHKPTHPTKPFQHAVNHIQHSLSLLRKLKHLNTQPLVLHDKQLHPSTKLTLILTNTSIQTLPRCAPAPRKTPHHNPRKHDNNNHT